MNRTQNELQLYLLFNLPYILRCLPYIHIIYLSSTCVYIILYLYINEMMMMMVQKNNKKFKEGTYIVALKIKKKFKKLKLYKK